MPEQGDIKKAHEVGRKGNYKMVWAICPICKQGRWSKLVRGKPESKTCRECNSQKQREAAFSYGAVELTCQECGEQKSIGQFYRRRKGKVARMSICKECFNAKMAVYQQGNPSGLYRKLKQSTQAIGQTMDMNAEEFAHWLERQPSSCHYCDVTFSDSSKDLSSRTIDRKNNDIGYIKSNMVVSCRKCNIIKGSWFSSAQMSQIARTYLKP